jgi:thioredoxin-like negative regulator of GroEL
MDQLSDCKGARVDIVVKPKLQVKHNIVVVPTVIIFNDGLEVKRFQANIMMELSASKEEVQEAIDDILMGSF